MIIIKIDGKDIKIEEKNTVLEAAYQNDIYIPTLCHSKNNSGHCRMCIVEVDGVLMPACTTVLKENMVINTNTKAIENARIAVLELILKNHSTKCHECPKMLNCKLQEIATCFNLNLNGKYNIFANKTPPEVIKDLLPGIDFAPAKCIACKRCINFFNKKNEFAKIYATDNEDVLLRSEIVYEKKVNTIGLIDECPTGALMQARLPLHRQKKIVS